MPILHSHDTGVVNAGVPFREKTLRVISFGKKSSAGKASKGRATVQTRTFQPAASLLSLSLCETCLALPRQRKFALPVHAITAAMSVKCGRELDPVSNL